MSNEGAVKATTEGGSNLPDILGNLRIVHQHQQSIPSVKFPPVIYSNPFGTIEPMHSVSDAMQREMERMFGTKTKCECPNNSSHQQRPSPSATSKVNSRIPQQQQQQQHTILHQKQFKQRKRNDLKLLREPTLRMVEQCLAHHGQTNAASKSDRCQASSSSSEHSIIQTNSSTNSSDRLANSFTDWNLDGTISDFKSLVRNCESLSLSSSSSSTQIPDLHKSRSFRTQQTKSLTQAIASRRKSLLLPRPTESSTSAQQQQQQSDNVPAGGGGQHQRPSCSQQALMNQADCCDVTIDELACYFETFVHIPKKMSTMAEMMYI